MRILVLVEDISHYNHNAFHALEEAKFELKLFTACLSNLVPHEKKDEKIVKGEEGAR